MLEWVYPGTFLTMTPTDVHIRPPVESDAGTLAAVHIAAWQAAYRGVMSDEYLDGLDVERYTQGWRRNILTPEEGVVRLVAQVGGDVVGFAVLGPARGNANPSAGQLYAINVHPDWWGKGVGTVLFAAAEQELISGGYETGFLWVEATNDRAIGFYTKRGWLDDGGTLQDDRFDPPVEERRHSRGLRDAVREDTVDMN